MISAIKTIVFSFFKKQRYYIKAVKTGESDIVWLMELSDLIKAVTIGGEIDVIRFKGDYTIYIGKI